MVAFLTGRSRPPRVLAWLAVPSVAGALAFTAGWLIAGRVQEHYNPRSDYISSLAAVDAANPWIMIVALVMFGVGVMSLGAGLLFSLPDLPGRIAALGVLLSGLGVIVVGSVRHDCGLQLPACSAKVSMGEISSYHAVHDIASVSTFVIAGASQLLLSRSLRREGWRHLRLPSALSGTLTLTLFVLMGSEVLPQWVGALQRAIAIVACVWVSTIGVNLYRLVTDAGGLPRSGGPGISGRQPSLARAWSSSSGP